MTGSLFVVIICAVLILFFSGLITAYSHSNKVYLGLESKRETPKSKLLNKLLEHPDLLLTSLRTGNIIAESIFAFYCSISIYDYFVTHYASLNSGWIFVCTALLISLLLVILTQLLADITFKIASNNLILILIYPTYFFFILLKPVGQLFLKVSDSLLHKVFKLGKDKEKNLLSLDQLEDYISEKLENLEEGEVLDTEVEIFKNALEFPEVKAREIMIPRTEVSALEVNAPISELQTLFKETGYSKIIIYQDTIDNIIGYVHIFELLKKPESITTIVKPIIVAPTSIYIKDLFRLLSTEGKSMAVIIDEYGGTSGIITLEDIIEELFGEIDDEHDINEELIEKQIDTHTYIFSARLDVDDLNEKYDLHIPESDTYSTLGGYIVDKSKEIPKNRQEIQIDNFNIRILKSDSKKIELVKFSVLSLENE